MDDPLLSDDARRLVADLTVRKQSIATAESLADSRREVVELQFTGTRWDIRVSAVRESISRLRALVAAE